MHGTHELEAYTMELCVNTSNCGCSLPILTLSQGSPPDSAAATLVMATLHLGSAHEAPNQTHGSSFSRMVAVEQNFLAQGIHQRPSSSTPNLNQIITQP